MILTPSPWMPAIFIFDPQPGNDTFLPPARKR